MNNFSIVILTAVMVVINFTVFVCLWALGITLLAPMWAFKMTKASKPLLKQTFYSLWISPRLLLSLLLWLSFIYSLCLLVWRHSLNSRSNKQINKHTPKQLFLYFSSFSWFMNNPSVVILTAVVVVIHFTVFVCLSGASPVAHSLSR